MTEQLTLLASPPLPTRVRCGDFVAAVFRHRDGELRVRGTVVRIIRRTFLVDLGVMTRWCYEARVIATRRRSAA